MTAGKLLNIIDEFKRSKRGDVTTIADKAVINRSYLSKFINGNPEKLVTEKMYRKLNAAYPDLFPKNNKSNVPRSTQETYMDRRRQLKQNGKKQIPFYDAEAMGGIAITEMSPIHAPAGTIDIGDLLHDSQAAIRIYGNSMLPNYPPGCVVGLIKCTTNFIEPGEIYVVETSDRRLLKRLFYKDDDTYSESFLCYSDNTMKFEGGSRAGKFAYPPFELKKEEIINLFVVTGVIKRNSNSLIINRSV